MKLLSLLQIETVVIAGHDFGATIAWYAAMMRPDIFTAVYCLSVPFLQPADSNMLDQMRTSGKHFYMFDMMEPKAAQEWADAKVTIPGFLYWSSGTPPENERWNPFDAHRAMYRPAPVSIPPWADPNDMQYVVTEFERTGFGSALNYYSSIEPFFKLARPFRGALIQQPAFFLYGEVDGVAQMRKPEENALRSIVPGVGHWPQQEAPVDVNRTLVDFLNTWA